MQAPPPVPQELYITTLKLGPKGQIVIPKEVRSRCNINPGDNLVVLVNPGGGFSVHPADRCRDLAATLLAQLPSVLNVLNQSDTAAIPADDTSEGDSL